MSGSCAALVIMGCGNSTDAHFNGSISDEPCHMVIFLMESYHPHYRGTCSHIWGRGREQNTLGTHRCPAFVRVGCQVAVSVEPKYCEKSISTNAAAEEKS